MIALSAYPLLRALVEESAAYAGQPPATVAPEEFFTALARAEAELDALSPDEREGLALDASGDAARGAATAIRVAEALLG